MTKKREIKEPSANFGSGVPKLASAIFATHNVDEIYFTSDNNAFIQMQYAQMHGETLQDKGIRTVKKREVE